MNNALVIVPVHLESKRLPRKALLSTRGRSLLVHTCDRITSQGGFEGSDLLVLTSDEEVATEADRHGYLYSLEPKVDIPTGTHRVAKFVHDRNDSIVEDYDWFINWQVDEPLVDPRDVKLLLDRAVPSEISTLVGPLQLSDRNNPNVVKVVWLPDGTCLWFTRAGIVTKYAHIGIYIYHRDALNYFYSMGRQQTSYAFNERLEQLNWIERTTQYDVVARLVDEMPLSINSQADWDRFCRL